MIRTKSYIIATSPIQLDNVCEFQYNKDESVEYNIKKSKKYVSDLELYKQNTDIEELHDNAVKIDEESDKLCSWLQIITACFSSFAHGSNDVANAIAPLATIFMVYHEGQLLEKSEVPIWILGLGGLGITVGLATWGYKIIERMGRELTKITPSRGFVIELAAATTIIIASRADITVSTKHCQDGSILGCGITGGIKNIKWSLVKGILFSWLITLPITGFLSAALFSFGYYSPYMINPDNMTNITNNSNVCTGYDFVSGSGSDSGLEL